METSNKSARELYELVKASPTRRRFGFGRKPALANVDLQNAYTRPAEFPTAYETDPRQIEYVNALARLFRANNCPVIWTYVAYLDSGEDCGVWGTRSDTPDSLQNIKANSRRAQLDKRCEIEPRDIVINKRMASAFFETNLGSLFVDMYGLARHPFESQSGRKDDFDDQFRPRYSAQVAGSAARRADWRRFQGLSVFWD